ncbi:MAG: hypothetical protein QW762_01675, partial [Candidatus Thermoplasmatota archaeon]
PSSLSPQQLEKIKSKCEEEKIGLLLVDIENKKVEKKLDSHQFQMKFDGFVFESQNGFQCYKVGEARYMECNTPLYFESAVTCKSLGGATGYGAITGPPGKTRIAKKFELFRDPDGGWHITLYCFTCNKPIEGTIYINADSRTCEECYKKLKEENTST